MTGILRLISRFLVACALAAVVPAATGSARATDLATNLSAVADTGLYEIAPTNNLGGVTDIPLGVHSGGQRSRLLVKFDPASALPAGARVVSAALTLRVTSANSGDLSCNLHRVLCDWLEGTKVGIGNGAPATAGETTWLARFHPTNLWSAPGGSVGTNFAATPSAAVVIGGSGSTNVLSTPAMAADVQAWLSQPATNFGWVLLAADEATVQTARRIGSRENTNNAPMLTVIYRVGPQLTAPALTAGTFSFSFDAESNQAYAVEYCESLSSGAWQTLTNIAPLPVSASVQVTDLVSGQSRFYRVALE